MATVSGTNGNDLINASFLPQGTTDGNDSIYAFGGDDRVVRSLGNDVIDGGEGYDVLDFSGTSNRVVINIPSGWLRELSGITLVKADRFTNFEEFRTGGGDDVIGGGGGDDFIRPGLGRDTINGGAGFDTLLYTDAAIRVFVDLVRGFAIDHGGNRDGFDSIESARGGSGNDVLRGGFDFLFLRGNRGSDTIISGYDGVGNTVGGSGIDHSADVAGVTVDLLGGFAIDGWGDRDTLIGTFFAMRGSAFNDVLKGSNFNNAFRPGAGSDLIDGREGFDRVDMRDSGFGDPDGDGFVVTGTLNADFTGTVKDGSGGTDTLISIEHLRGSSFRDKLSAAGQAFVTFGAYGFATDWEGAWTPVIEGWAGDDVLIGAAGRAVIARYATDQGAIIVDLAAGFAIDPWGDIDTLTDIWGIRGTSLDDVITLGSGHEWARGDRGFDILDGGAGIDRVSYTGAPASVLVDLAAGFAEDGWGTTDTLTGFEAVSGSTHDDTLLGDAADNWFIGGQGSDFIDGRGGSDTAVYFYNTEAMGGVHLDLGLGTAQTLGLPETDTLVSVENAIGSRFADTLLGDAGANSLYGFDGDDTLQGRAGNDLLDGGAGSDTASYADAPSRVVVNLTLVGPQNTLGAGFDTLVSIENLIGSGFNDTLTGDAGANRLVGGVGNDALYGGAGDDVLDGGPGDDILQGQGGIDTASYASATAGVTVSLLLHGAYQNTIGAGSDWLNGIESLRGSAFNDALTGNALANVIEGGDGNDLLDGDAGIDTASYATASVGVRVSLALQGGAQDTAGAGIDTLVGFENLLGSAFNDLLMGDAGANTLWGGDGDDVLEGGLGNDHLYGGAGIDLASYANAAGPVTVTLNAFSGTGSAGTDWFYDIDGFVGSAFNDTLTGNAGDNVLIGGDGDDRLFGLAGNDTFVGGAGNDQYYGGDGIDTVDFSSATLAVRAILGSAGFVNTINYGSDLFNSIENLIGGQGNDTLTGDANANRLEGRAGNDTIDGGAGDDMIVGGEGNDQLTGGLGADLIDLGTGSDIVRYLSAADSRAASMDRITNFTQSGGDGFDRIGFENNANALFTGVAPTAIVLGARIAIEAASTIDDLLAQLSGLTASTAGTLSVTQVDVGFGGAAGRYLAVNDTTAAYDAATDMLISIGMAPGSTTNLTAANFFLF